MTEFMIRLRHDRLAPNYQAGDVLTYREQDHADEGQLAVLVTHDDDARVDYYRAANGYRVIGVVTLMCRRIPGATNG